MLLDAVESDHPAMSVSKNESGSVVVVPRRMVMMVVQQKLKWPLAK